MQFASPLWLFALLPVLVWGAGWSVALARNHRRRQERYATSGRMLRGAPDEARRARVVSQGLLTCAAVGCVVAMARPQGRPMPAEGVRTGVNLALLVDGSHSMLSNDVAPTRLDQARRAVEEIAATAGGSRFSLFMFGGTPTLLIPRTFDISAVMLATRSITPAYVGKGGTALKPAIERATAYLATAGDQPKVIVIVSDGEEGEGDPILAALQARTAGKVRIHTVAVGRPEGGTMPAKGAAGASRTNPKLLLNVLNEPIVTHANPTLMARIAEAGGGKSLHLDGGDVTSRVRAWVMDTILPEAVAIDDAVTEEPREWAWIPLLAAGALLVIERVWVRRWQVRVAAPSPAPRTAVLTS